MCKCKGPLFGGPLLPIVFFRLLEGPLLPIVLFQLFWRSTGLGRWLIFFLVQFPVECRQNHVWEPLFDPSYDHILKYVHFVKVELGHTHG